MRYFPISQGFRSKQGDCHRLPYDCGSDIGFHQLCFSKMRCQNTL